MSSKNSYRYRQVECVNSVNAPSSCPGVKYTGSFEDASEWRIQANSLKATYPLYTASGTTGTPNCNCRTNLSDPIYIEHKTLLTLLLSQKTIHLGYSLRMVSLWVFSMKRIVSYKPVVGSGLSSEHREVFCPSSYNINPSTSRKLSLCHNRGIRGHIRSTISTVSCRHFADANLQSLRYYYGDERCTSKVGKKLGKVILQFCYGASELRQLALSWPTSKAFFLVLSTKSLFKIHGFWKLIVNKNSRKHCASFYHLHNRL